MDAFLDETSYKFDQVSKLFQSIAEISIEIYNHVALIAIQNVHNKYTNTNSKYSPAGCGWRSRSKRLHSPVDCRPHRVDFLQIPPIISFGYLFLPRLPVVRPDTVEMSAWGVAALAGIQVQGYHQ